jgi:hypothetical protein
MESVHLVKHGFFFKSQFTCKFFNFKDVKSIYYFQEFGQIYLIKIVEDNSIETCMKIKYEEHARKIYQTMLEGWMNYHSNYSESNGILNKLDALLNHIEVMPGGEEAEKAKARFEAVVQK